MDPLAARPPRPMSGRSQIALELAILAYAAFATLVVARLILRGLGVDHRLWIGRSVYRFTDPIVDGLVRLPGADRGFAGDLTLPDLTLAALVALIPLGMIARGRHTPAA